MTAAEEVNQASNSNNDKVKLSHDSTDRALTLIKRRQSAKFIEIYQFP